MTPEDRATFDLIAALDDAGLAHYVRAGERYVGHVPAGPARDRVERRLHLARAEQVARRSLTPA